MNPPSPSGRASAERPSDEVVVRATGLTKVFKDFWGRPKARAVDNVDFEIRRGEVFGLLGPNGSGKSTTIKLLLGLLYPTKGHITVFGQSPRDVATKARIGYLPEESYLYRFLNPAETLDFFGSLFQIDSAERRRRAMSPPKPASATCPKRATCTAFLIRLRHSISSAASSKSIRPNAVAAPSSSSRWWA
jgi:ABC-type glutathione transport system ATPase component